MRTQGLIDELDAEVASTDPNDYCSREWFTSMASGLTVADRVGESADAFQHFLHQRHLILAAHLNVLV